MPPNSFLGRALMDPATGLPNIPYFSLIRDWEDQRAQRRKYTVRVVKIWVEGGADRIRRALSWHLCQEMRSSDLIASEGRAHYRILLTSPDAENIQALTARVGDLIALLNKRSESDPPMTVRIEIEPEERVSPRGPCDDCPEPEAPLGAELREGRDAT